MTKRYSLEWGGRELSVELGKMAHQANGSCLVRYGDTVALVTACLGEPRDGIDFMPLTVECEERLYAAGKIKSSRFMKREGRPNDEAVVTARTIDRSIRPLFNQDIRCEVQIVITVLAFDKENDHDILGLVGAAVSLGISDIPWDGPIGAVRVGRVNGEWVLNPTYAAREKSDLDLYIAGTGEKTLMIEAGANEAGEEVILEAFGFAKKHLQKVVEFIQGIVKDAGVAKRELNELTNYDPEVAAEKKAVLDKAREFIYPKIKSFLFSQTKYTKAARNAAKGALLHELDEYLKGEQIGKDKREWAAEAVEGWVEECVTKSILEEGKRVDGRALDEVRPLSAEVALLPRVHGSGLFQRGETQILSVVTLGAPADEQIVDSMELTVKKRYFHHYNFPPYAGGETGRIGGTGRREIGHGNLAEKALLPVLPKKEDFPYTIRVVSETMGSNGSSSQGSVCGSTLSLMDAGVPIKKPVAGIAMGLASDFEGSGKYQIITDLQDLEDGDGGMDFKVAGTRDGITAIQLDTKTKGLPSDLVEKTLKQAKAARLKILDVMAGAIAAPRPELSPYAPRIVTLKINPELIRNVIGPGGKVINEIIEKCGVQMDVENDGTVTITSAVAEGLAKAKQWVEDLTREIKAGELFPNGKVTRIMDFGAFVEVLPGQEGLVHISELAPFRVNKVTDVVKVGDVIPVYVYQIDELGRVNLSLKRAKERLAKKDDGPSNGNPA